MNGIFQILSAVGAPFFLLFIGCLARRMDWLGKETDHSMTRLIIYILYPCFIVYHVLGSERVVAANEAWVAGIFGFTSISAGFLVARIVVIICRIKDFEKPAFCFCSGIFNYGFFAIPVAAQVFGHELVVKIILFNLGVEVAIWTVGILILTRSGLNIRKILNPPAVSVLVALILQALGGKDLFPNFAWETLSLIGNCSIPMALMIIGASFYDLLKGYRPSPRYRVEFGAILTRGLLVPSIFLLYAIYGWVPDQMSWIANILVVQAAMPAGVFALVVVKKYEQDAQTGLRAIMATMLSCLISLPAWLWIGTSYLKIK